MSLERKCGLSMIALWVFICMALNFDASVFIQVIGFIGAFVSSIYGVKVSLEYERVNPIDTY